MCYDLGCPEGLAALFSRAIRFLRIALQLFRKHLRVEEITASGVLTS